MQKEMKIDHVTDDDGLVTQWWSVNLGIHVDVPEGVEVEYYGSDQDDGCQHLHTFVQVKPETKKDRARPLLYPDEDSIFFTGYEVHCEFVLEDKDVHMDKLDRLNRNL